MDLELGNRQALPEGIGRLSLTLQNGSYATLVGDEAAEGAQGEELTTRMATLGARYFFGQGWSAGVNLPMGTIEHIKPEGDLPQRISGFGDAEVALAYDLAGIWGAGGYSPSVTVEVGLRLPTGQEGKTLGGNLSPTLLALGWGAFGLSPRLTWTQFIHPQIALALPVGLVVPLGTSPFGLTYGTGITYGLTAVWLPGGGFALSAGADGRRRSQARSEEHGRLVQSGGHWLVAALGASMKVSDRTTLMLRGRLPLRADVNGTQLTETWSALGTVAWRFGEPPKAKGHDHDHHRDDGASMKGDNRHIARGGQSFELTDALVPGKITVIDYWADWCAPCKKIGALLDEMAAHHPNLAVRKAEVPALGLAIAKERLPGVQALPVVHIYAADGKLLKTLNGTSASAVKATLRALLAH